MPQDGTIKLPSLDEVLNNKSQKAQERTLLQGLGTSLSDGLDNMDGSKALNAVGAVGKFAEDFGVGAIESASFGFLDGKNIGLSSDKNSAGYALGNVAGYFAPYGGAIALGGKGVKALGTAVSASKLGQKINAADNTVGLIKKALPKGTPITRAGKKVSRKEFIEDVVKQSDVIKGINNFDDVSKAFRAGKMTANKVDSIMKSGVGSYLDDVGKKLGYSFGKTVKGKNTAVEKINKSVEKYWTNIGGKPINTLPDLITEMKIGSRFLGTKKRGKVDTFLGYAAEDALAYAMVEGAWVASRSYRNEEQYLTPQQFLLEMAIFGPVAAGTRFIRGGAPRGPLNITNSDTRNTIRGLIRGTKNYYKNTNVKGNVNDEARKEVTSAYLLYKRMNQPALNNNMDEAAKKLSTKQNEILRGHKSPTKLKELIEKGTLEQKEAAAEYMKLSLNGVGKAMTGKDGLRREYGRFIAEDFLSTKPRQAVGALAMSGGHNYFFGHSIDPEQMGVTAAMGYFLFKRGHRMTYKGKALQNGESQWTTTSTGWSEKLGDRQIRLDEQVRMNDAMGLSIDHPVYAAIRHSLIDQSPNAPVESLRMATIDSENPVAMQIKSMLDTGYLKPTGKQTRVSKKDRAAINKMKDKDQVEAMYNNFAYMFDNYNYVNKDSSFKKFSELSKSEIDSFKSSMDEFKIRPDVPQDLIPLYVKPIISNYNQKIATMTQQILDIYSMLGIKASPIQTESNWLNKAIFNLKRIEEGDISFTDVRHRELFSEFMKAIDFANEFGTGRIKIQDNAKILKINDADIKDKDTLVQSMQDLIDDMSKLFTSDEQLPQVDVGFGTDFLQNTGKMMQTITSGENIPVYLKGIMDNRKGDVPGNKVAFDMKELMQEIFSDDGAYRFNIKDFDLKALNNSNRRFIEAIAPLFRGYASDDIKFNTQKKLLNGNVTKLRQLFIEDGNFNIFSRKGPNTDFAFNQIIEDVNWKEEFLRRKKVDVDGDVVPYNNIDRIILQNFESAGLLTGRNSNTIAREFSILGDINLKDYDNAKDFLSFLESYQTGDGDNTIKKFVKLVKESSTTTDEAATKSQQLIKDLQDEILPYILKTENGETVGHLRPSDNKGKPFFKDIATVETLIESINQVKSIKYVNNLTMFDTSVRAQIAGETKTNQNIIKNLYKLMAGDENKTNYFFKALNTIGWLTKENRIKRSNEIDDGITNKVYQAKMKEIINNAKKTFKEDDMIHQRANDTAQDFDVIDPRQIDVVPNTIPKLFIKYPGMKLGDNFTQDIANHGNDYRGQLEAEYLAIKLDDNIKPEMKKTVFLKKIKEDIMQTNKNVDEAALDQELISISGNLDNKIKLKRITFDEGRATNTFEELAFEQNPLFRGLAKVFEVEGRDELENIMFVINNSGHQNSVYRQSATLDNMLFYDKVVDGLTSGELQMVDGQISRIDTEVKLNDSVQPLQAIPVRLNEKTVIAVNMEQNALDIIANRYVAWRKDNDLSLNDLESKFFIRKAENEGIYKFDLEFSKGKDGRFNGQELTKRLSPMMRDLVFGQVAPLGFGKKTWMQLRNSSELEQFQSLKRFKLHDNKSAKTVTNDSLQDIVNFIDNAGSKNDDLTRIKKTAQDIINKKYKIVVVEDEGIDGVNALFSQKQREIDNRRNKYGVDIENLDSAYYDTLTETQKAVYDSGRQVLKVMGDSDVSIMDAATFQPPAIQEIQALLLGVPLGDISKVSGNKILGHRAMDDGEIGLMKTAGLKNVASDNIPKEISKHEKIIFVAKSGFKDLVKANDGSSMSTELNSKIFQADDWSDFTAKNLEAASMDFRMDDISLLSVKQDKQASLPPNLTGFFATFMDNGVTAVDDFIQYNYKKSLQTQEAKFGLVFQGDRRHAREEFLTLAQENTSKVNAEIDVQDTQPGVLLQLAQAETDPLVMYDRFFDMFADKHILNRKVESSNDAVIQPDLTGELMSMIADKKGVIEYSETIESHIAGNRNVDVENLAFIIKNGKNGRDKLFHISDIKKELSNSDLSTAGKKKLSDLSKSKNQKNLTTLKDWVDELQSIDEVQVAAMSYRNPITKSNSIIIEGIKSIGNVAQGNKKVVSSGDVIHQLKGDYDIDDVISLYSQPASVWNSVNSIQGKHIYTPEGKTIPDSHKGFSLKDDEAFNLLLDKKIKSNVLKGAVMNMPEVLRFLTTVESLVPAIDGKKFESGGLSIKVGENRIIRVKPNINENFDLVAKIDELNQKALDSETNPINQKELSGKKQIQDEIFWGENGVFEIVDTQGDAILNIEAVDKVIVREYVGIFEKYLRNSGGDFSTGRKRSVRPSQKARIIEQYAQDLSIAKKIVKDKVQAIMNTSTKGKDAAYLVEAMNKLDFGQHNVNSNFFLKLANSDDGDYIKGINIEGVSPRDFENIIIYKNYRQNLSSGNLRPENRINFDEEFTTLAHDFLTNQKLAVNTILKGVSSFEDASQKIKFIERQHKSDLKELSELKGNEETSQGLIDYLEKRTQGFEKKSIKLKRKMVSSLFRKMGKEKKREIKARIRAMEESSAKKSGIPVDEKLITQKVNDKFNNLLFEPQKYQETLSEITARNTTGVLEQRIASEGMGLSRLEEGDVDAFISNYRKDFDAITKGTSNKYAPLEYDRLQFDYEADLYRLITENSLEDKIDAVLVRMMAPKMDMTTPNFTEINGTLAFTSGDKSLSKRINLAMKFNNTSRITKFEGQESAAKLLTLEFGKTSRDVVDFMSGKRQNIQSALDDTLVKEKAPYQAFTEQINTHDNSLLNLADPVQALINNSGISKLSFYEQFYLQIGTGIFKSTVNKGGTVGDALIAHNFRGGGDYRVEGITQLKNSLDKGVTLYNEVRTGALQQPGQKRGKKGNFLIDQQKKRERSRICVAKKGNK